MSHTPKLASWFLPYAALGLAAHGLARAPSTEFALPTSRGIEVTATPHQERTMRAASLHDPTVTRFVHVSKKTQPKQVQRTQERDVHVPRHAALYVGTHTLRSGQKKHSERAAKNQNPIRKQPGPKTLGRLEETSRHLCEFPEQKQNTAHRGESRLRETSVLHCGSPQRTAETATSSSTRAPVGAKDQDLHSHASRLRHNRPVLTSHQYSARVADSTAPSRTALVDPKSVFAVRFLELPRSKPALRIRPHFALALNGRRGRPCRGRATLVPRRQRCLRCPTRARWRRGKADAPRSFPHRLTPGARLVERASGGGV